MKVLVLSALGLTLCGCVSESCYGPLQTMPIRQNSGVSDMNR